ncbi:UrcA family protein [Sphingomonas sp. SUN039]|uniref:UrcA family protein n=1 Tax=Sphingomonas sp. SUN039 TaxID=2937787 RepID=UPI00216456DD|nr:UrcA family protein [Sphingomonas sp. SUN039]UVO55666.1 UrcA family protein [Sphingomonas sp. SUN039]
MNILITLLAAAVVTAAVPVSAQETASVRVATRDIDLSTTQGQRILDLRIDRAAHSLCDLANERFDLNVRVAQRQCRQAAVESAIASVQTSIRLAAR